MLIQNYLFMEIYWIIIAALLVLACFDLMNGVANDAVNFLNSAIGSKAAPVRVILTVASIGVVIGAVFSSGMMEIARTGVFHPQMFSFHEVMLLFLAVMVCEVILLDTFNTFGLPTSTTVSLIFGLLGSAVASALFKINEGGPGVPQGLATYINSAKALEIVSGILVSVAVAFTVGTAVMWISRLAFSFRYHRPFKWFGAVWCGLALTAICYFALFKGMKQSSLVSQHTLNILDQNLSLALGICFAGSTVLMGILQHLFMANILRITVLAGTFALALAFAGNDLVNFIGVFVGGLDSFGIAQDYYAAHGEVGTLMMDGLRNSPPAQPYILLCAGAVMVFALWFSKKAKSVIATGVELSRQGDGGIERFGSIPPARAIVRVAIGLGNAVKSVVPGRMLVRINRRWEQIPTPINNKEKPSFDLIRASVNLTVAALLISSATSLKLPLSTTYVTFMVAMGTSLADKAWGRESAVYRITGVLTVISGWFLTALAAFTLAAVVAVILHYGQAWAIFPVLALTGFILIKSAVFHRKKEAKRDKQEEVLNLSEENLLTVCSQEVTNTMDALKETYDLTIRALIAWDRKELKDAAHDAEVLSLRNTERHKYDILPMLYKMQSQSIDSGYHFVQALDHLNEISTSMEQFTDSIFNYVDNNHTPLSIEQIDDLKEVHDKMIEIFNDVVTMLRTENFSQYDHSLVEYEQFLLQLAKATKRQIKRAQRNQSRTRSSILYLSMLNEMRFMTVQLRALVGDQKNFLTL